MPTGFAIRSNKHILFLNAIRIITITALAALQGLAARNNPIGMAVRSPEHHVFIIT
jgi:hypothetical protein